MEEFDDNQSANYPLNTREKSHPPRNSNKQSQISNSKVCSFYSSYGFCKFGQNCKYLHKRNYFTKTYSQIKSPQQKAKASSKFPQKIDNNYSNSYEHDFTETHKNIQKRTCRYYKAGQCDKGENCFYNHNLDSFNSYTVVTSRKEHLNKDIKPAVTKKKSIPICHYFSRGSCMKGDQCKFYHNPKFQKEHVNNTTNVNEDNLSKAQINNNIDKNFQKITLNDNDNSSLSDSINSKNACVLNPSNPGSSFNHEFSKTSEEPKDLGMKASSNVATNNYKIKLKIPQNTRTFNLVTLSEESLFQLRETEIVQLKKRFPKLHEDGPSFSFDFEPTDPDWPFDTKSLHLQVTFPESYPLEVCNISVVTHMNYIPGVLLRHLNQTITDWLNEKHNAAIELNEVILLFRPFLKWFDKNLEELFNAGLKKMTEDESAQNIVKESALPENDSPLSTENPENGSSLSAENPESDLSAQEPILPSTNASSLEDIETEKTNLPSNQKTEQAMHNNSQMQGSKAIFTGLELVEGVAALSCKKLAVTLQCSRCKTSCNKIIIPNKNTPMVCSKCSRTMECNFNPSILHQFSSVLGTIYLLECQAVDVNLVECAFLVDCLSCSKQVSVDGLHYGQKQKLWCKFCNQKLNIGIEGVKFQASAATAVSAASKTVVVKKVTKIKDPVIKEGCPLPDNGACKHYKKSYRWLRFPCCGRLYPCDLCHDEKEADHDMKYASRMVCGFCSKEQPYSKEKPCFGCSSNMTKKSGSYWEGGQGCRNSITMSRKDVHKYAGMSKTTSKKSQPTGKKKK